MNTNHIPRPLLVAVLKCALTVISIAALAITAVAQTNTFPSSGNAGVGTTSPGDALHIVRDNGGLTLDTSTSGTIVPVFKFSTTGTGRASIQFRPDLPGLSFQTGGIAYPAQTKMVLTDTGFLGLGTTTPGRRLEILAPDGEALRVYRNAANVGWGVNMVFAFNNSSGQQRDYAGVHGLIQSSTAGSEQGNLILSTTTGGSLTEKLRVDSSGKVGIGLTAPLYSLDVNGGVNAFRAKASTANSNDTIATFENSSGIAAIVRANGNVGIGTLSPAYRLDVAGHIRSSSGGFVFPDGTVQATAATGGGGGSQWSNASGGINYTAGNVAIGTSTPAALLDVRNSDGYFYAGFGYGANKDTYLRAGNATNGVMHIGDLNTSKTLIQEGGGNVGIATNNPSEKLEVNGNLKVSGTGNITAAGTIEGGNIKAKYQDIAEWVPTAEQLPPGTVVVLDTTKFNQVVSSTVGYDTRVAGVISEQPGITLGEGGAGKVLVATTGRVRVKVDASRGPIQIGDLLVTSDLPGVAMRSDPVELAGRKMHMPGTIIGKALAPLPKGRGEILVLLSLQ